MELWNASKFFMNILKIKKQKSGGTLDPLRKRKLPISECVCVCGCVKRHN
jgi:hypothetical protein